MLVSNVVVVILTLLVNVAVMPVLIVTVYTMEPVVLAGSVGVYQVYACPIGLRESIAGVALTCP